MAAAEAAELIAVARDLAAERDRRRRLEAVLVELCDRVGIPLDLGPDYVGINYVDSLLHDRDADQGKPLEQPLPAYFDPTGFDAADNLPEPRRSAFMRERERLAAALSGNGQPRPISQKLIEGRK